MDRPAAAVRLKLDDASRHAIEMLGIRTYGRMAGFASAVIPMSSLAEVSKLTGIQAIQAVVKPKLELTAETVMDFYRRKQTSAVIRHVSGDRVVAMVEIVSPGNKGSRAALRSFVEKSVDFLRHGVHLLVVDLFPRSARDPQGIHKAIWDEIEDQPFELPPGKPLTLATYYAGVPKTAYVEPVGVGDVMPDMAAYLDLDSYVPVPLEATYQATWESCPEDMREAVERGEPLADEAEE